MNPPTLNTQIGLAFLVAIPALAFWSVISGVVWWTNATERRWSTRNYRLSVTVFLAATTIFVADLARLRFHADLWSIGPDATSWTVFTIRWIWAITILWSSTLLAIGVWRRLQRRSGGAGPPKPPAEAASTRVDPYLDEQIDERRAAEVHRQVMLAYTLTDRLREALRTIDRRIETDQPIVLEERRRHG